MVPIWCYSVQTNIGTIPSAKHNRSSIPGTKQNRSGFSQTPQHVVHAPLWFLLERADLVGESSIIINEDKIQTNSRPIHYWWHIYMHVLYHLDLR